jgi:hypothetical protein
MKGFVPNLVMYHMMLLGFARFEVFKREPLDNQLLMLGPDDWASGSPNPCLGKCRCQWDMTWTLEVQPAGEHDSTFQLDVATARENFERQFEAAEQLSDTLPKFDAAMPYNQRVMAHVLRQSLSASMKSSGISELSAVEARRELHP